MRLAWKIESLERLILWSAILVQFSSSIFVASEPLVRDRRSNDYLSQESASPWITGPSNKKYQFHLAQTSWLAAREHCLAQNSDLVTIQNGQELHWVLDHYTPHFTNMLERYLHVGLLANSTDGNKRWHWIDQRPLNTTLLNWIDGEPFDHEGGHERCAVLLINQSRIDDVHCDKADRVYRFICQRTHDEHVKHEELNNPLWKKLQDILDFFGIRGEQINATKPAENEEDYWEEAKKESTNETNVENLSTTLKPISDTDIIEGSGEDLPASSDASSLDNTLSKDELLTIASETTTQSANNGETADSEVTEIIQATSTESTRTTIADKKLETTTESVATESLETATIAPRKTTAPDQLNFLRSTYDAVLSKHIESLENIVKTVERIVSSPAVVGHEDDNDQSEKEFAILNRYSGKKDVSNPKSFGDKTLVVDLKEAKTAAAEMEEDFEDTDDVVLSKKTEKNGNNHINSAKDDNDDCDDEEEEEKSTTTQATTLVPSTTTASVTAGFETKNENEKTNQIAKFINALNEYLKQASSKDLKKLVDESNQDGGSLLQRLNEAVENAKLTTLGTTTTTLEPTTAKISQKKKKISPATIETTTPAESTTPSSTTESTTTPTIESTTTGKSVVPERTTVSEITTSTGKPEIEMLTDAENNATQSVFPMPDFDLLKQGIEPKIPADALKRQQEEKKSVDAAYSEFNRRIDTSALIKRIEQAERFKTGSNAPVMPKPQPQQQQRAIQPNPYKPVKTKAYEIPASPQAVQELEIMFSELSRNLQHIVQG